MAPVENVKNPVGEDQTRGCLPTCCVSASQSEKNFFSAAHAVSGLRLDVLKHLDDSDDSRHRPSGVNSNTGFLRRHQSHQVDVGPFGHDFNAGRFDWG